MTATLPPDVPMSGHEQPPASAQLPPYPTDAPMSVGELPPIDVPLETLPENGRPYYAADLVVEHPDLWARPANRWPLAASFAAELDRRLAVLQPRNIVEVGSGSSTLILGRYARATGARVTSLEHDEKWAAHTLAELELEGLAEYVDIHLRPLHTGPWHGHGRTDTGPWYMNAGVPDGVDFVLVDGPPERLGGRAAVLPALYPHLVKVGWELWLDDAMRPGETTAVCSWLRQWPHLQYRREAFGTNGAAIITPDGGVHAQGHINAADVCVTILTGQRPDKLARLLDSLERHASGLLETAQVVALHNGGAAGDEATRDILQRVGASLISTSSLYPIGRATTLLERASRVSGARYWLHLEDDWEIITAAHGWLDHARELLSRKGPAERPAQVRLRHASERTLRRHLTTGKPFSWAAPGETQPPHLTSTGAHLTFNPFLALTGELTRLFPTESEKAFMADAHALGLRRSAQLYPGVFRHTGDDDSLRARVAAKIKGE